jgi:hypothetical protein
VAVLPCCPAAACCLLLLLQGRTAGHSGRDGRAIARSRILVAEDRALDLVEDAHGLSLEALLQAADLVVALAHRLVGALDDRAGLGRGVGR